MAKMRTASGPRWNQAGDARGWHCTGVRVDVSAPVDVDADGAQGCAQALPKTQRLVPR